MLRDRLRVSLIVAIAVWTTPSALAAEAADPGRDWPLFRGDSRSTGVARTTLPDQPVLLWTYQVPKGSFEGTSTSKATGSESPAKGKFVTLYRREADGAWKAVWDIYNSDLPEAGKTADGADEQALMQIERDWAAAAAANDAAGIDRLTAAEYAGNSDGRITPKKQVLADIRSGASKVASAEASDLKVFVVGDTAIVHGLWAEKATLNGKDMSGQYRFIDTFIKRDGRWQAVATFSTKLK